VQPSWYKVVGEEFVSEGWAGDVLTVFGSFADGHEDYAGSVLVFFGFTMEDPWKNTDGFLLLLLTCRNEYTFY